MPPKGDYFGWKVLGRTVIEGGVKRERVISAIERGIAEGGWPPDCFDPRHAIHATQNERTVDLLICFRCSQVMVYLDGNWERPFLVTSSSPEPILDKVLIEANVPLAPKPSR